MENSKTIVSAVNKIMELLKNFTHYPKLLKMLIKVFYYNLF